LQQLNSVSAIAQLHFSRCHFDIVSRLLLHTQAQRQISQIHPPREWTQAVRDLLQVNVIPL